MAKRKERINDMIDFLVKNKNNSKIMSSIKQSTYETRFQLPEYIARFMIGVSYEECKILYRVCYFYAKYKNHCDEPLGKCFRMLNDTKKGEHGPKSKRVHNWLKMNSNSALLQSEILLSLCKKKSVNYKELAYGLIHFDHPDRWIQNKIAKDFWKQTKTQTQTETK
jgi:hypothetical protein